MRPHVFRVRHHPCLVRFILQFFILRLSTGDWSIDDDDARKKAQTDRYGLKPFDVRVRITGKRSQTSFATRTKTGLRNRENPMFRGAISNVSHKNFHQYRKIRLDRISADLCPREQRILFPFAQIGRNEIERRNHGTCR